MADDGDLTVDNMPIMTLSYANGEGFVNHMNGTDGTRINLMLIDTSGTRFQFPATVPMSSETHGGDDVAVFASGPWAHLFSGNFEQSVVPHLVAYASCIGDADILKACDLA